MKRFLDWFLNEYSGRCHCGTEMDSHSAYDGHSPVEMVRIRPVWQGVIDVFNKIRRVA